MRMRRVVGQCNQADLEAIEHLAVALENPAMLDVSTLTRKQKFAFHFIAETKDKGIPWKLLRRVVREVLFWGENEYMVKYVEVKFVSDHSRLDEIRKFRELWRR